jgi:hypothetical protein
MVLPIERRVQVVINAHVVEVLQASHPHDQDELHAEHPDGVSAHLFPSVLRDLSLLLVSHAWLPIITLDNTIDKLRLLLLWTKGFAVILKWILGIILDLVAIII